jgi:Ferredoxin-like domain in Api92-like protein
VRIDSIFMPNWCDNRLAIRGTPAAVRELVELAEGDIPFDFERILPMPKHIHDGGAYDGGLSSDTFPGWYQWSCEHWGTKWNAWDGSRRGYGRTGRVRYRFFTAYDPPLPVFAELARRFPSVEIELTFEVELWGSGRAAWRDGELVDYSDDMPY